VDMQEGLRRTGPKHDLAGVVDRLNQLASRVRGRGGRVIFIQHAGRPGYEFEVNSTGWQLLEELLVDDRDLVVSKSLNDPFVRTNLTNTLDALGASRILVGGWATDFCVDACVRSAVAYGHPVIAIADGHTLDDRPHLSAERVIEHHNWVWSQLIASHDVQVKPAREL
jgi:nicotinamidase-related amidase